ncbi:MAG: molybdate ABC transporter substrate-binding protein [Ktedonobacter sp. 13_1_20CM_4_53_7]|nr:MAG: molybdate ABC transporter substrate-binding protein [Ktedonobacter sp. 13_1_20CM_4_53_7]
MRRSRHALMLFILLCTLFLAACGGSTSSTTSTATTAPAVTILNVFAAASLKESFNVIAAKYTRAHPNITIKLNFAGSQILEQQVASGAPADVFASADQTTMQKAVDAGLVGNSQVFVKNRLTVIIPAANPGNINTLKDLSRKGVKIDIGAPAVPAGKYSLQVLAKMAQSSNYGPAYENAVKANFVSQETDVKAVVNKVQLGEVDAGFVYVTDVTAAVSNKIKMIDIPDNFNVIAQYPIAVTKSSAHSNDARAFVQYILSPEGQAVLQQYHFIAFNP